MTSFTKLLALFALFFINVALAENKPIFSKHLEFPSATTSASILNSVASYVLCHDVETTSDGKHSRKCSITHGTMVENAKLSACEITFQGKFSDDYTTHTLSSDKVLLIWCDDDMDSKDHLHLLRYTLVQVPGCKTTEATVAFDDHKSVSKSLQNYGEAVVINGDGTYDAFFENPKYCGEKVCRLTIDSQGKIVKGPMASYVPIDNPVIMTEATTMNSTVGIAELGIDSGNTRLSLITPEGLRVLSEFRNAEWTNNDLTIGHGMIRGCSNKGDVKVECETFDANGNSLSKSTMDMGNQDFDKLRVSNMPNGDFILLTESSVDHHGNVTKFDANNKRIGSIELAESITRKKNTMISVRSIYKENNQYCISKVCYDSNHVYMSKHCYDDKEFK